MPRISFRFVQIEVLHQALHAVLEKRTLQQLVELSVEPVSERDVRVANGFDVHRRDSAVSGRHERGTEDAHRHAGGYKGSDPPETFHPTWLIGPSCRRLKPNVA